MQGGPFSPQQVEEFQSDPLWKEKVEVRYFSQILFNYPLCAMYLLSILPFAIVKKFGH